MKSEETEKAIFPPIFLILIAVLLWSFGGLFIKLTALDAFSVNLGRSLFAALTVAVFTFRKGLKPDAFTILTSFLYAGTLSCFVYANKNTTAANAIFLQYTAPIYILIFAPFILKEKFRVSDLLTVLICLAGMSFFFLEPQNAANKLAANVFAGNIAAIISGLFFGLYFVLLRHPKSLKRNPAVSVFYGNIIIVLLMLPIVSSDLPTISNTDIFAILFLGIFQIGIAYILFTRGLASGVRSLDASIIGFVEPLLNPVWVFFFIGERPSIWAIFGGIIIIFGVMWHTLRQHREKQKDRKMRANSTKSLTEVD